MQRDQTDQNLAQIAILQKELAEIGAANEIHRDKVSFLKNLTVQLDVNFF